MVKSWIEHTHLKSNNADLTRRDIDLTGHTRHWSVGYRSLCIKLHLCWQCLSQMIAHEACLLSHNGRHGDEVRTEQSQQSQVVMVSYSKFFGVNFCNDVIFMHFIFQNPNHNQPPPIPIPRESPRRSGVGPVSPLKLMTGQPDGTFTDPRRGPSGEKLTHRGTRGEDQRKPYKTGVVKQGSFHDFGSNFLQKIFITPKFQVP